MGFYKNLYYGTKRIIKIYFPMEVKGYPYN